MVKNINGLGGTLPPKTNTEQSGKQAASAEKTATQSSAPNTIADDVQLSSGAKTLQTLAAKVNSLPDVNVERAEQIRAALERGEYQVDDLVLADKIMNSEALFGK
ncbi:MAG: flagellar biosynthesis anti-sigma factor FlgM [Spongiibacteraceae bacterium]